MRVLVAVLLLLIASAPARAQDHVASDGVELIENIRTVGAGQGLSLVGDRLFATSPTHLSAFDVSDPESPVLLGTAPTEGANETEDVVTNGRVLAVTAPACRDSPNGCVTIFDVSAGAPERLSSLPIGGVIASCVLDCRYLWVTGSNAILDLADPAAPKQVGTFLGEDEELSSPCYQAREVRPGLVLVACDPILLISALPEHGGSPTKPVLVARGNAPDADLFLAGGPHSVHWPRAGEDAYLLTTTETAFHSECTEDIGAFVTWDAPALKVLDRWRPQNGTYLDGRSPYNAVGCSPHFLDEHPTFHDGGLVAVAALENGLRLLSVGAGGAIEERGWFLGAGGTAAVPVWHPNGKVLYLADYARGLDVLRYGGDTFVPPAAAPAPAAAVPAAPARRLRIAGASTRRIAVEVPGPGTLTARGRGLRTVRARAREAGLVTLAVKPRRRPRRKTRVRIRIAWRPVSGDPATLTARVTLRR